METIAEFAAFSRLALHYMHLENRTVADIARLLNVNRSTAHRWIHGSVRMPKDRIEEFCNKLHLLREDCEQLIKMAGYTIERPPPSAIEQETSDVKRILNNYIEKELDFVACYHRGTLDYVARSDLAQRLQRVFIDAPLVDQLELYIYITEDAQNLINQLDAVLKPLRQGRLIRVILDIEIGGVFYYYICEGVYIFGFTTKQTSMDDGSSDNEMRSLKADIEDYMGIH